MVHSFNENFIYGLKLDGLNIDSNSKLDIDYKIKKGIATLDDFISNHKNPIEKEFLARNETVSIVKRKEIDSQIYTANLAIDMTNPLLRGTFNTFITENTNITKRSTFYKNLIEMNPECHFVYFSPVADHVNIFRGISSELNSHENSTVFSLKYNTKSELYLITKILPKYLNSLRDSGKHVVLILEDIEVLYMELYGLFKYVPTDVVYSFIREMQTICCNFNQGSISTICFKESESSVDVTYRKLLDDLNTELILLSTSVVDTADRAAKKGVKNAFAGFNLRLNRTKAFSPIQSHLSFKLYEHLLKVL